MRNQGKIKLGFYPLPVVEAKRLKNCLSFQDQFSAVDPCVGDGVAFSCLLEGASAHRYGIEIDAHRAEQAKALGIGTVQANALDVRCPAESLSLLYLNPPYGYEFGTTGRSAFAQDYGVLETITKIEPAENACSKAKATTTVRRKPGFTAAVWRIPDGPLCLRLPGGHFG